MKKTLILATLMLTALFINAQNKGYTAPLNESGEAEYKGEIFSAKNKEDLIKKVKNWFITSYVNYTKESIIDGDIDKGEFTIRGTFKGRQELNPFSGTNFDQITYLFNVKVEEGKIMYNINSIKISNTYVGWGANVTNQTLEEKLNKVANAKAEIVKLQSQKGTKKQIKEHQETIEDETKRLEDIIPPIEKIIAAFKADMSK